MTVTLPPRFDPLDAATVEDPYPVYARLREAAPLCRFGPAGWGVTRYADVVALQRDPRLGSEFPDEYHRLSVGPGAAAGFFARIMLYRDPPVHLRLRRLMGKAFTPALVRRLRGRIEDLVDQILDPALERGGMDVVSELAYPLPVMVVCAMMGIPPEARADVRHHATALGRAFTAIVPDSARSAADEAVGWLRGYLGRLLDERRRVPTDDLLSELLRAEEGGEQLTHDEIVDNAVFAFFAGFETTVHLITTGCAALLRFPDQLARLRADTALVPTAVEEFLRYDAPIQGTARMVRQPLEIGGRTIRPGRVVVLMLGSANRDGNQFPDPDRLDIGRTPNPHVTFGGGAHLCLGAFLARIEGAVVFEKLRELAVFEAAGVPVRQTDTPFRGYDSVPVHLRRA
ncbi:MAG TPA: cytochrome P450 [Rugosimonospora sp.]|nr:cytochrome P450 [Rugosimonospora sp.]